MRKCSVALPGRLSGRFDKGFEMPLSDELFKSFRPRAIGRLDWRGSLRRQEWFDAIHHFQYSSAKSSVETERSASVMIQRRFPVLGEYADRSRSPAFRDSSF